MDRKQEYQDERWKERAAQIRELDNHKCAMCGAKDVELHVHHLSYPPPPFHLWDAADNELVTLCKECHEKVHDSATRPTLMPDRTLICEHQYVKDKTGERMVSKELYHELFVRGYTGKPYTQQIIDWMTTEHWVYPHAEINGIYEKYADGRERDRASDFNYVGEVLQIRASCVSSTEEFEDYGDAEIAAIKLAIGMI